MNPKQRTASNAESSFKIELIKARLLFWVFLKAKKFSYIFLMTYKSLEFNF
jgi:hypothetical protein